MPNWCFNYVDIRGNKTVIDKIRKEIEGEKEYPKLFSLFYPIPEELNYTVSQPPSKTDEEIAELVKKYGAENWYHWSIKNWGCKWDARDIEILEDAPEGIHLKFETPWGPPIDFYKNLANDYKVELDATYTEESMACCGKFQSSIVDGDVSVIDDCFDPQVIQDEVLSRYLVTHKNQQVTGQDFLNKVRSIYDKNYPEMNDYHDSEEMFSEWWFENRLEEKEFCAEYGIITKETT